MRTRLVVVLVGALLLASCSDDEPDAIDTTEVTSAPDDATPTGTASPDATGTAGDGATAQPAPAGATTSTEPADGLPGDGDPVSAELSAAEVVPGPGDDPGSGTFAATIVPGEASAELCYRLDVAGLASAVTGAHLHAGAAGEAGPVFVALQTPEAGSAEGCVTLEALDAVDLLDTPSSYYVQVHTEGYPAGAVRGQLAAG